MNYFYYIKIITSILSIMSSLTNRIENLRNIENVQNNKDYSHNLNDIEYFLNNKVVNMYERPWQKLEMQLKLNKVKQYYESSELSLEEISDSYNMISKAIRMKLFKTSHVVYNSEKCVIENIKYSM